MQQCPGACQLVGCAIGRAARPNSTLLEEVQRRLEKGGGQQPKLEAAVKQALEALQRLVPSSTRQGRPSRSSKTSSVLQEGQRKAVRAALAAGVAPTQVAKHFGLSLAVVRKVLAEAA